MTYVKRLVMYGFKSFPRKTEIPFDTGINVILGPNGSGKSNISDALCFVLGRLSIKSIRAKKASNLIFMGTKVASPSKEAMVEIIFSNEDKTFTFDSKEVSIKRIVRRNGQSLYKINNETKTRTEILSLLAQAGIDPHGFNIILQGEIQNFVRMKPEERRGIIEEVSGISVYESRKEKSLKELDKTEERLKEVYAILRERTAYLNNLEKERQMALKFKKLENDVKVLKASIINQDLNHFKKESEKIKTEIENKIIQGEKIRKFNSEIQLKNENMRSEIDSINKKIQQTSGFEQEKLNREIADIRAQLAGLSVKRDNFESKISQLLSQKEDLNSKIIEDEKSLRELNKEAPMAKKEKDIERKKAEFDELEKKRKHFYMLKSELKSVKERVREKEQYLASLKNESETLLRQINDSISELYDSKPSKEKLNELKSILNEKIKLLEKLDIEERAHEKETHTSEYEINKLNNLVSDISKLDVCPLCKSKVTKDHIKNIKDETKPKLSDLKKEIENHDKALNELYEKRRILNDEIAKKRDEISKGESDLNKLFIINEKKNNIKFIQEKIDKTKTELTSFIKKQDNLEKTIDENVNIEQKYETSRIELQEISLMSEETIDSEISFKQRETQRMKALLKQIITDEADIKEDLSVIEKEIEENEEILNDKSKMEQILINNNQKLISHRDNLQSEIRENESIILQKQNLAHNIENEVNEFKINKARVDASLSNLEIEILSFPNIEIIKSSKENLIQRLNTSQENLSRLGTVNLRSLEVYENIKKEYDLVQEKAEKISKEKNGIMKIIHEIDVKKKKAFSQTLYELNESFSRNFSQLSTKGHVSLEIENKKDPFESGSGVQILVKTGHGKFFDVTSLSGGEQTLVALSLIFAIQELKPYHFYILDEIDAALDKRNSERLAGLLKKYMQKGQYIVITHNDEIITNASNLYGVSMHEGVSKLISLKL